jgi:hypothetical protein
MNGEAKGVVIVVTIELEPGQARGDGNVHADR